MTNENDQITLKDGQTVQITTMNDVEESFTNRICIGVPELDAIFGSTQVYEKDAAGQFQLIEELWGIARGKLVCIGGGEGAGKTRLYMTIAIMLIMRGLKVVVFQLEMTNAELMELAVLICRGHGVELTEEQKSRLYIFGKGDPRNFHPAYQAQVVAEIGPDLAVVDSYWLMKDRRTDDDINKLVDQWKNAIGEVTAAWFVCPLNERGVIKGNNHIRYMTDGWMALEKTHVDGVVRLKNGKNRNGKPTECFLQHERNGMGVKEGYVLPDPHSKD